VTGIVEAARPEAVLLLIGTEDALEEPDAAATVPGEVVDVVNKIHAVDPSTHVLVANLPVLSPDTRFGPGLPEVRAATNAGLEQAVRQLAAQGGEVSLVDTGGIGLGNLVDGIQLNPTGHAKLAQAWFDAVLDALPPPGGAAALGSASAAGEEAGAGPLFDQDARSGLEAAVAAHDFIV
jgi:hypothetical protein